MILVLTLLIVSCITIYFTFKVEDNIDKYILYFSIIGQIFTAIGILYSPILREIGHLMFGIALFSIGFLSKSNPLLLFSTAILLYVLISREILGTCMYNLNDEFSLVPQIPFNITYDDVYFLTLLKVIHRLFILN